MKRVVVVGAGRQGVAAAYDLATYSQLDSLAIVDFSEDAAKLAATKVNELTGNDACKYQTVDATDSLSLIRLLSDFDLAVASAPYKLNPNISHAGIEAGCSVVDMGLDTPDALTVHERDNEAKAKGISCITDCGVAPGLVNIVAYKLLKNLVGVHTIKLYCGGLPETAHPPFYHQVGFSVESLIGEYVDTVEALKNGVVVHEEALQDFETLDFPGFGSLEAVTTSGGTGTAPYDLVGKQQTYEYKTLRYVGHWAAMNLLLQGGFWSEEPLVDGTSPLAITTELMERAMVVPGYKDVVVARVVAYSNSEARGYDLVDRFDVRTGFTAMQRTTGFSTAIVAKAVLDGKIDPGCMSCEKAIDPDYFFSEAQKRQILIQEITESTKLA